MRCALQQHVAPVGADERKLLLMLTLLQLGGCQGLHKFGGGVGLECARGNICFSYFYY